MTPKTLTIRAAEADDDEAVSSLLHQLGYDVSRAEVRRRLTLPGLAQRVLVAVLAERIVGLIAYTDPIERLAEGTTFVRITAIVVDEACRKDGVGQAMMREVERRARDAGAGLLELTCGRRESRKAAHVFYPRLGFVEASVASILYRKDLAS